MKGSSIKTGRRLPCAYYGDHVATRFRRWVWSGLGGRSSTGDHVAGYLRSLFPRPLAEMGRQVDDGSTSFVLPSRPFFVHCKLIGYLRHPCKNTAIVNDNPKAVLKSRSDELNSKHSWLLWKNNPERTGLSPGITKTLICYTVFTSRKLWGLVVSEIYNESFEEWGKVIDQMGRGFYLRQFPCVLRSRKILFL